MVKLGKVTVNSWTKTIKICILKMRNFYSCIACSFFTGTFAISFLVLFQVKLDQIILFFTLIIDCKLIHKIDKLKKLFLIIIYIPFYFYFYWIYGRRTIVLYYATQFLRFIHKLLFS